jgi:hypothetical protein
MSGENMYTCRYIDTHGMQTEVNPYIIDLRTNATAENYRRQDLHLRAYKKNRDAEERSRQKNEKLRADTVAKRKAAQANKIKKSSREKR